MEEVNRIVIPNQGMPIRSLCWVNDELIDWVGGGGRYQLDGGYIRTGVYYPYNFDHAVVSPNHIYAALLVRCGTKGLLLKNGKILREINRSYYHASVYEYPFTFLQLPTGETAIAHCPDEYCRIEIEEVETGRRLTERLSEPVDFFYSRLAVSADNKFLLSAGWIWHPFDYYRLFDLEKVLSNPEELDAPMDYRLTQSGVCVDNAVFGLSNELILTTFDEYYNPDEAETEGQHLLPHNSIAVYDQAKRGIIQQAQLSEPTGILMALDGYAVSFFNHPKLIDLSTGSIRLQWDELDSGRQSGSIIHQLPLIPPLALDSINKRFAVASEKEITVTQLG
jgi:hypothetical protein